MVYGKNEAIMTRGLAILSMIILHLFCRLGNDIMYTPLVWVTDTKPLMYYFGFFAEICVPLYSLCVGYAQFLLYEKRESGYADNGKRIFKVLKNYWIILFLFCGLGMFFDTDQIIPGTFPLFLESIVLLHSYNGAWWYLNSYIILLLVPAFIIMEPIKRINSFLGIIFFLLLSFLWYVWGKFNFFSLVEMQFFMPYREFYNFMHILPYVGIGAILCKSRTFDRGKVIINKINQKISSNLVLGIVSIIVFILFNIVHLSALAGIVAIFTFLVFNLFNKHKLIKSIFLFLGKHSTNIWLTHMFFYLVIFKGLVWQAKYAVLIVLFMLLLCVLTSYIIIGIEKFIDKLGSKWHKMVFSE